MGQTEHGPADFPTLFSALGRSDSEKKEPPRRAALWLLLRPGQLAEVTRIFPHMPWQLPLLATWPCSLHTYL